MAEFQYLRLMKMRSFSALSTMFAVLLAMVLAGCASPSAPKGKPAPAPVAKAPVKPTATPTITPAAALPMPIDMVLCNRIQQPKSGGFLRPQSFVTTWYRIRPATTLPSGIADRPVSSIADNPVIHRACLAEEKVVDLPEPPVHSLMPAHPGDALGCVDWGFPERSTMPPEFYSVAYAAALISADREMTNLILYTGSDDYLKVWINGRLVHSVAHDRSGQIDQDEVRGIKLRQGLNLVVMKAINHHALQWRFFFRLADGNGAPLEFAPAREPVKTVSALIRHLKDEI